MKSKSPSHSVFIAFCLALTFFISYSFKAEAYTVSALKAESHHGQIFLTWTTPNVKKLQYNVYRSTSKFTSSSQLTSSKFMGFVRDSSSKNIFWTQQSGENVFFKIQDNAAPLTKSMGLYVVTCTDNQSYYYAVTVTKLSDNSEDKTIVAGQNSLSSSINETVEKPQPVWQDSIKLNGGEVKHHYVQYGTNQDTPLYPAMNSVGSYGFNYYIVKRGNAASYPLFILCEGFGAEADKGIALDSTFSNCYILGIYDWLPIPTNNGTDGDNTYFCCYHERFNIYSNQNPIPTSGVIRTYPQNRYQENIKWLEKTFPIDTTRIYIKGTSANGFGALLTATIHPEQFAAVYAVVEPASIGASSTTTKQLWGESNTDLNSDILDWSTGDSLTFNHLTALQKMLYNNAERSMPVIFDVHGRNDQMVHWSKGRIKWLDSVETNHIGGAWYWDQREHGGSGKNFTNEETQPNFYRYATNKSYPAFSNCSINQDPGIGTKNTGTDYGAINGYLDFDDDITDNNCSYSITVFVKDFYVGGELDPEQYNTCTTNISFRRMQNFQPAIGSTIKWKNWDSNLGNIQNGSFTYHGGLITIKGITVNKTGNTLQLKIKGCSERMGDEADDDLIDDPVYFSKSSTGYTAHISLSKSENIQFFIYNLLGGIVWYKNIQLHEGENEVQIPYPATGIFLAQVKGQSFSHSEKLFF